MPWTSADAEKHTKKADTPEKRSTWAKVANKRLSQCLAGIEGEPSDAQRDRCEASAIKVANAMVGNVNDGRTKESEEVTRMPDKVRPDWKIEIDKQCVTIGELENAWRAVQLTEAEWTRKFINDLPDLSFAIVLSGGEKDEDGKTVPRSLRKLPFKDAEGTVDLAHLRNALARLPQSDLSAEQQAKARKVLQAAARKHLETHQESDAPDLDNLRDLLIEALALLCDDEPNGATEGGIFIEGCTMGDVPVAEAETPPVGDAISITGRAVRLVETGTVAEGGSKPLIMEVYPIIPGWGNKQDNHYYGEAMLRQCAPAAFKEVKMYETNHRPDEKSNRTWVSTIIETNEFTDEGKPISRVGVHDPYFAAKAINLNELELLHLLECSIWAEGMAEKFEKDGREGKNVVEILSDPKPDVDWVTRAGAGGHARRLTESSEVTMTEKEKDPEKVQEAEKEPVKISEEAAATDPDKEMPAPEPLAAKKVTAALAETNLPDVSKTRLSEGEYVNEEALKAAIKGEVAYVKELTGSGKPFAQGASTAPEVEQVTEEQKKDRFNRVMREIGAQEV